MNHSVVSGGVLCVVGVLLCGLLLPRFVAYDERAWKSAAQEGGESSGSP
jgi:hypothetical protein